MACRFVSDKLPFGRACFGLRGVFGSIWRNQTVRNTVTVATAVVILYKLHKSYHEKQRRNKWNSAGKDVVVIHAIGRSTVLPHLSPYVLKLETYLRMAGIKYELETSVPYGPKGKFPWITFNGEDMADSQFIQEYMGAKFNKNFSANLTPEEKGIARAFLIMVDEHMLWAVVWWRMIKDPDCRYMAFLNWTGPFWKLMGYEIRARINKGLWFQGLGRHNDEDIVQIIGKNLEAISNYLGKKAFLMGEEPCEIDCAVFGNLAQFVWAAPGSPFASMVQGEHRNLMNYCIRMRNKFYPDWDDLLLKE